jgi:hypothetical protein
VASSLVGQHSPPDVCGDAALQAAHGFVAGLAFGEIAVEEPTAGARAHADLGHGDEVQRGVQLSVAAAGEAVGDPLPAGHLDAGHAGVAGERNGAAEPGGWAGAANETDTEYGPMPSTSMTLLACSSSAAVMR